MSEAKREVWVIESLSGEPAPVAAFVGREDMPEKVVMAHERVVRYVPAESAQPAERAGVDAEHQALTLLFERGLSRELVLGGGTWYTYATDEDPSPTPGAAALKFARHLGLLPPPPQPKEKP